MLDVFGKVGLKEPILELSISYCIFIVTQNHAKQPIPEHNDSVW